VKYFVMALDPFTLLIGGGKVKASKSVQPISFYSSRSGSLFPVSFGGLGGSDPQALEQVSSCFF
jgi:hypothetical protein